MQPSCKKDVATKDGGYQKEMAGIKIIASGLSAHLGKRFAYTDPVGARLAVPMGSGFTVKPEE